MIGDEISCLKNFGLIQLSSATSQCQSFNASQILPRSRKESSDLIPALLSLDLTSENGNVLVSIGIYKTKEGKWYDSTGQLTSYFNWLSDEPNDLSGKQSYAGLQINKVNESFGWAKHSGTNELNVVCTKRAGHGKRF